MNGSTLASDGERATLAWIIAARRFDHGKLIPSDHLTEPRSLTLELINAPGKRGSPLFAYIARHSTEFSSLDRWASTR
jgi:hypothetical protein